MNKILPLFLLTLCALSAGCDPNEDAATDAGTDAPSSSDGGPTADAPTSSPDAGTDAPAPAPNGVACAAGTECLSGFCTDGVCCDTACDGTCVACAARLTDGADGTCSAVPAEDPEDECEASGCRTGSCAADGCEVQDEGVTCRPAAGDCDLAEVCDGSSPLCPADAFAPSTAVCAASLGPCDVAETCTGSSADCPTDAFASAGTVCRAPAGTCDAEERCDGSRVTCPGDAFLPTTAPVCGPYTCPSTGPSCRTSCSTNADCAPDSICSIGACVRGYRMFVTSTTVTGNFGSAAAADAICAARASAASLPGVYRAWVSDGAGSAANRLANPNAPFYRVDGTTRVTIVNSWSDLIDGITVAIATDEFGTAWRNAYVWTGTNDDGTPTTNNCVNWTSTSSPQTGTSGNSSAARFSTFYANQDCNRSHHLYCVEQPSFMAE